MAHFDVIQAIDNGLGNAVGSLSRVILQANQAAGDDTIILTTNTQINEVVTSWTAILR